MTKSEIAAKAREIKELKIMLDELTAEITSLEDELKAEMTATGTEEIITDIFKIRYTTVTSNRFDTKAFKATHAELYQQYTKPTTSKRFSIN